MLNSNSINVAVLETAHAQAHIKHANAAQGSMGNNASYQQFFQIKLKIINRASSNIGVIA